MATASREKPRANPYLPPFDPGTYRAKASDWVGYAQKFPELWGFKTFDEFDTWRGKEHPEIPSSAWDNRDYYQEYYAQFPEERKSEHELAQHYYEYEKQEATEAEQQHQQEKAEQQHRMQNDMQYAPKGYEVINKVTGKLTAPFRSEPLSSRMALDQKFIANVDKLRAQYQKASGDKSFATIPTFIISGGKAAPNPELLKWIPDLFQRAEGQLRREDPDRAAKYDQKAQERYAATAAVEAKQYSAREKQAAQTQKENEAKSQKEDADIEKKEGLAPGTLAKERKAREQEAVAAYEKDHGLEPGTLAKQKEKQTEKPQTEQPVRIQDNVQQEVLVQQGLTQVEAQLQNELRDNARNRRNYPDTPPLDPEIRRRELALQILGPSVQQNRAHAQALAATGNIPLLNYVLNPQLRVYATRPQEQLLSETEKKALQEVREKREREAAAAQKSQETSRINRLYDERERDAQEDPKLTQDEKKKKLAELKEARKQQLEQIDTRIEAQRQAMSQPTAPRVSPVDQAQKDLKDLEYSNKYIAAETEREIQRRIAEIKAGPFSPIEQENRIRSLQTRRGEIETEIRQREFARFVKEDIARAGRLFHENPDIREASNIHNAEIPEAKRREKYGPPTTNVEELAKTLQEKAVQLGKAKYDQKVKEYEALALGGYNIPKPVLGDFINTERSALDREFVIANPLLARELAEKHGGTAPWLTTTYSSWRGEKREKPTQRQFTPEGPLQHRSDTFLNKFHQDAFAQAKILYDQTLTSYAAKHGNSLPEPEYQRILWHGGQYQEIHEDGKMRLRMIREGDHPENTTAAAEYEEDYEEHGEKKKRKVKAFSQTGLLNDALQAQMLTLFLTDPTRFAMYSEKDPFFKTFAATLHELDRNFAEAQRRANSEFQQAAKQYMAKRIGQPPNKAAMLNRMLLELDKQFVQRHPRMARLLAAAENVDHQYKKRLQKALGLPLELPKQAATPSVTKGQRATTPSYTQQMMEHIASYGGAQPPPSSIPSPSSPSLYGRRTRIPRPRLPRSRTGIPGAPGLPRIPGVSGFGGQFGRTALRFILAIPHVRIALGIAFLIILLLIIILAFMSFIFSKLSSQGNNFPVYITKSAQVDNVPNPQSDNMNDFDPADIEYTMNVRYDGQAEKIIVTDELYPNVNFKSATGPGTITFEKDASNKVTKVTWEIQGSLFGGGGTGGPLPNGFDQAKFTSYGFPAPQSPNPVVLSGETLQRWNQYVKSHAIKAAQATGVDVGIIGMWPFLEGSFIPFDNCNQEHNDGLGGDNDHNTQCPLWNDYWQVGLGLHPAYTIDFVQEGFDVMYGSHDAATVQRVGQQVIQNLKTRYGVTLTIVPSFPNTLLDQIINGSKNGNLQMRNLLTTLMKDEALGTYLIARHFKKNILLNSGTASKMEGWSAGYYNRQKIINYVKAIYDAEKGASGATARIDTQASTKLASRQTGNNKAVLAAETACGGQTVDFSSLGNFEKRLLPLPGTPQGQRCENTTYGICGRRSECVAPRAIVMHTTEGSTTAEGTWSYFNNGSDGIGVGSSFAIGNDGKIIQMVDMSADKVERDQAVGDYRYDISIEMGSPQTGSGYTGKDDPRSSPAQYAAALKLVKALMKQYNIPLGDKEWDYVCNCMGAPENTTPGVYGHYQLQTLQRSDPGRGWMRDFREDIKKDPSTVFDPTDPGGFGSIPPLNLVVRPKVTDSDPAKVGKDTYVYNQAKAVVIGAIGGSGNTSSTSGTTTGNTGDATTMIPPSMSTCGGTYNLNSNPLGKNYGDPACDFTKDKLYFALKELDPANADDWFNQVVPCESPGYDPNLYFAVSPAGGAWGLFQMDRDKGGGAGDNGPLDRGDVWWKRQAYNATQYNKTVINSSFNYWACRSCQYVDPSDHDFGNECGRCGKC